VCVVGVWGGGWGVVWVGGGGGGGEGGRGLQYLHLSQIFII